MLSVLLCRKTRNGRESGPVHDKKKRFNTFVHDKNKTPITLPVTLLDLHYVVELACYFIILETEIKGNPMTAKNSCSHQNKMLLLFITAFNVHSIDDCCVALGSELPFFGKSYRF